MTRDSQSSRPRFPSSQPSQNLTFAEKYLGIGRGKDTDFWRKWDGLPPLTAETRSSKVPSTARRTWFSSRGR
jgi:hypothetical protein